MKFSSFAWFLVFAVLVFRLTSIYFEVFRTAGPPTADIDSWLKGDLPRPFVTRVLVPSIVAGTSRMIPDAIRERIEAGTLRLPFSALPARPEYQMLGLLVMLCFAAYTVVMRPLVRAIFGGGSLQVNLITICSLVFMPVMFQYHNYCYDPATLLLSTLLWYLMYRERWKGFFVVFLVACLNKETALIFLLSAALWRAYREGARASFRYVALLVGGGFAVRGGIALWSMHLPGSMMELHLFDHNLPHLFMYFGVLELTSALVIGFLVFSFWKERPEFLKIGTLHLAIMVAMALFGGYIDEFRLYFDGYAILVLTITYSLMRLNGRVDFPITASDRPFTSAGPRQAENAEVNVNGA